MARKTPDELWRVYRRARKQAVAEGLPPNQTTPGIRRLRKLAKDAKRSAR